jgi:intracellular multiplication protein IcmB
MKNDERFAINPLECSVCFCEPPAQELAQMVSFITSLVTPVEALGEPEEGMTNYVDQIIRVAFKSKMHDTTTGNPRLYEARNNAELDALIHKYNLIDTSDDTNKRKQPAYYEIRDRAHNLGDMHEGVERIELYRARDLAHRYAMPILSDLTAAANNADIKAAYDSSRTKRGEEFNKYFTRNITEAIQMYRVFSKHTRFDLSYARVVSIDLQDVIGSSGNAKQSSLFFQIARIFSKKKVAFSAEDLPLIPPHYRSYYKALIEELAEDRKIIAMDELHNAAKDQTLFSELARDGREARKWGTEICLASQMLDDFGMLTNLTTRFVIADAGTSETRQLLREKLALKPAEERALKDYVGLGPGGLTYLARFVCKTATYTCLLTLTIGPQRLWALTTDADDRLMRDTMYQVCNQNRPLALKLLAKEYPGGAKSAILAERQRLKTESLLSGPGEGFDEDKASASITTIMANKIMDEYIREERARQERLTREVSRPENLLTPQEIAEAQLAIINENRNRLINAGKGGRLI